MALSDAFGKLKDGLQDLGSLEVRSFSGDVSTFLTQAPGGQDFQKLFDKSVKDGVISLKIYTRLDADGDSDHFVADSGVDSTMAESHVAAFQMGQEIRRSYIELFKDLATRIIT
jgi:hypothetical protein